MVQWVLRENGRELVRERCVIMWLSWCVGEIFTARALNDNTHLGQFCQWRLYIIQSPSMLKIPGLPFNAACAAEQNTHPGACQGSR